MPRFRKNGEVNIQGEKLLVNDILDKLTKLSSESILSYFNGLNLSFARKLRISALKNVFRDRVLETRQNRHTLADEMNYRLSWFNQFTETQLVNLFKFYKEEDFDKKYKELLWITLLNDMEEQNVQDHDFKHLFEYENRKSNENLVDFNNNLNSIFYDVENEIDGLTQEQIRPVLYKSSTITEIRELGKKYGVNVPTRLRKNELLELIFNELKERGEYSEEKAAELKKMNLILIQRYTKLNDIKVSTELKKEEVIEYILSNAHITKGSYYVPSASLYEEIVEKDVPEEIMEVEKEEPVIEEEPEIEEEVVEEKEPEVIVEEKIVYVEKPVEKIIYKEPTQQVVHKEEPVEEVFDYEQVEEVNINTTEFHLGKPKVFHKLIKKELVEQVENEENQRQDNEELVRGEELTGVYYIRPADQAKTKKKKNIFIRFLIFLLSLIFIIALILFIYALATHRGTPSSPEFIKNAEEAITKFFGGFDIFEKFRWVTSKILG